MHLWSCAKQKGVFSADNLPLCQTKTKFLLEGALGKGLRALKYMILKGLQTVGLSGRF